MNPYPKYKDSGEQWLGQIPEHWEMRKMKFCFLERSQKGLPKEPLLAATQNHGVILKSDYENRTVEAIKGLDSLKLVEVDDFVISLRSFQGGIERSYARGIISPAYTIIKPTHVSAGYFKYLGKSPSFISLLQNSVTGIREGQNIDYSKLKNRQIPLPPLAEQEAMVAYLDEQTGKIDAAIEREQKMIDLLEERKQIIIQQAVTKGLNPNVPMKDSGIEWIGKIPEGWEIVRLKQLVDFAGRIGFRGYGTEDLTDEENGAITLSPSNMQNGKMTYQKCAYLKWHKYYESPEIMVFNGDILFVKTGSTYGKTAIVNDLPKEATINPQLLILKNIKGDNRFIAHMLSTPFVKNQVERIVIGGTIPTISQEKIGNIRLIVPNKEEQVKISEHIIVKTKPIDAAIKAKEKLISLLQERKQIIINEVVTGKIKVS